MINYFNKKLSRSNCHSSSHIRYFSKLSSNKATTTQDNNITKINNSNELEKTLNKAFEECQNNNNELKNKLLKINFNPKIINSFFEKIDSKKGNNQPLSTAGSNKESKHHLELDYMFAKHIIKTCDSNACENIDKHVVSWAVKKAAYLKIIQLEYESKKEYEDVKIKKNPSITCSTLMKFSKSLLCSDEEPKIETREYLVILQTLLQITGNKSKLSNIINESTIYHDKKDVLEKIFEKKINIEILLKEIIDGMINSVYKNFVLSPFDTLLALVKKQSMPKTMLQKKIIEALEIMPKIYHEEILDACLMTFGLKQDSEEIDSIKNASSCNDKKTLYEELISCLKKEDNNIVDEEVKNLLEIINVTKNGSINFEEKTKDKNLDDIENSKNTKKQLLEELYPDESGYSYEESDASSCRLKNAKSEAEETIHDIRTRMKSSFNLNEVPSIDNFAIEINKLISRIVKLRGKILVLKEPEKDYRIAANIIKILGIRNDINPNEYNPNESNYIFTKDIECKETEENARIAKEEKRLKKKFWFDTATAILKETQDRKNKSKSDENGFGEEVIKPFKCLLYLTPEKLNIPNVTKKNKNTEKAVCMLSKIRENLVLEAFLSAIGHDVSDLEKKISAAPGASERKRIIVEILCLKLNEDCVDKTTDKKEKILETKNEKLDSVNEIKDIEAELRNDNEITIKPKEDVKYSNFIPKNNQYKINKQSFLKQNIGKESTNFKKENIRIDVTSKKEETKSNTPKDTNFLLNKKTEKNTSKNKELENECQIITKNNNEETGEEDIDLRILNKNDNEDFSKNQKEKNTIHKLIETSLCELRNKTRDDHKSVNDEDINIANLQEIFNTIKRENEKVKKLESEQWEQIEKISDVRKRIDLSIPECVPLYCRDLDFNQIKNMKNLNNSEKDIELIQKKKEYIALLSILNNKHTQITSSKKEIIDALAEQISKSKLNGCAIDATNEGNSFEIKKRFEKHFESIEQIYNKLENLNLNKIKDILNLSDVPKDSNDLTKKIHSTEYFEYTTMISKFKPSINFDQPNEFFVKLIIDRTKDETTAKKGIKTLRSEEVIKNLDIEFSCLTLDPIIKTLIGNFEGQMCIDKIKYELENNEQNRQYFRAITKTTLALITACKNNLEDSKIKMQAAILIYSLNIILNKNKNIFESITDFAKLLLAFLLHIMRLDRPRLLTFDVEENILQRYISAKN